MGLSPAKDMQTSHLSFDPLFMKEVECAETNKNLFSDISDFYFSSYRQNSLKIEMT